VRDVLPNRYVARVPVAECQEPLVEIRDGEQCLVDARLGRPQFARASAVAALTEAATSLPGSYGLLVVEGYRAHERQVALWQTARAQALLANPRASADEIDRLATLVVANPLRAGTVGHQTGAAVDLTLADESGRELWMGTGLQEFASATPTRARVEADVAERRMLLASVMTAAGFANYPGEWWHYSIGDQLWAAYRRHPVARFGPV
jgi:D-alanyl-D-alanine dipeptidase